MTTPRRRVLRPTPTEPTVVPRRVARLQRRHAELAKIRTAFRRWLTRLKRATNTVTDLHLRITRLEAALASDLLSHELDRLLQLGRITGAADGPLRLFDKFATFLIVSGIAMVVVNVCQLHQAGLPRSQFQLAVISRFAICFWQTRIFGQRSHHVGYIFAKPFDQIVVVGGRVFDQVVE
jgi:hypothetical protein